ncbi:MAG: hypothetical protein MRJ65_17800 [Candidatus Brocadiaceae bacterium]|nr:hypothetical protein [Candidatus Brocadiaceae bacterium]
MSGKHVYKFPTLLPLFLWQPAHAFRGSDIALSLLYQELIFFTKVKVITEPFSEVMMLALGNFLLDEDMIELNRNVLWNIQKKPLA